MTTPISFPSTTPAFALPLLFAGQAQKEFFLNQAFSVVDAYLSGSLEASLAQPPVAPAEGALYRVLPEASGDWAGQDDALAAYIAGDWVFSRPQDGMRMFDRQLGASITFDGGWKAATPPPVPTGGTTIDTEARASIAAIVSVLREAGILPQS
ncbi:DUF2793 domain-containing protein [Erythrobacter sp.]|jgi:hypothetical protein|uniref:DUF2793 domain-containing protein n=1 Tax=Erythrobacter sp. TaxID=1042 RepID=UPI002ECB9851|nr:DUF2793 domain-containing protein [Erythrobacter sp.]